MQVRQQLTCPLEITHDYLRGKWKPIIIWRLRLGKTQLVHLENDIKGIGQKMLIQQLRELIEFGIVAKESSGGYPLQTFYFLTAKRGQKALQIMELMQQLGIEHMQSTGKIEQLDELLAASPVNEPE
ncbi:MAG: winged helix-turn-helix transcriptional regulator [Culicoidibacterales bacterium]